jgi:hypothetical protein
MRLFIIEFCCQKEIFVLFYTNTKCFWISAVNIVMHMAITRQQLGKHIPEVYALNNRRISIAR